MKFTEHLSSHLTPEWRKQYVQYEFLKEYLYKCLPSKPENADKPEIYYRDCDKEFFIKCSQELKKINNFFSEKISEALRKFEGLEQDLTNYQTHINSKRRDDLVIEIKADDGIKEPPQTIKRRATSKSIQRGPLLQKFNIVQNQKFRTLHNLKLAFSEFYLSLILLQNYQSLNYTGFRKILKKHDKLFQLNSGQTFRQDLVDHAPFNTSKEVDNLILQVENIYTNELESGDRQKAMKRLRVPPLTEVHNPWITFRLGLFIGIFVMQILLIVLTWYIIYDHLPRYCAPAVRIFRSTFMLLTFLFLIGIDMYCWRKAGVNHVLIFEIDPRNHLSPFHVMEKSVRLLVVWGACVLYFMYAPSFRMPAYIGPFVLVLLLLVYVFNPFPIFNYQSRIWLLTLLKKIFVAPFYTVHFADFWLADQLNSVSFLFVDIGYFICFFGFNIQYSNGFKTNADLVEFSDDYIFNPSVISVRLNKTMVSHINNDMCNTLWYGLNPLLKCLPAWFRFAQCLRRYYDNYPKNKRVFPHLVNAGKYCSSFLVVGFSAVYSKYSNYTASLVVLLAAYIMYTVYTCSWDILMDWGLFDFHAQDDTILRDELVYQYRAYYYAAIVENIAGRLMWVPLVLMQASATRARDIVLFLIMFIEVFRRFVWNLFRLENEHLNNCGEFRAVRDIFVAPIKHYQDKAAKVSMKEELRTNLSNDHFDNSDNEISARRTLTYNSSIVEETRSKSGHRTEAEAV